MTAAQRAQRRAAGAKGGRSRSPAKLRAARENASQPRPARRDRLPQEVINRLGPPPALPADLRAWNARVLSEVLRLQLSGDIGRGLAEGLRASVSALDRLLPPLPRPRSSDDDDDEEDNDEDDRGEGLPEVPSSGRSPISRRRH